MSRLEIQAVEQAQASDLPWPDIYFAPGYGAALSTWTGQRWLLASWDGLILFPFLLRPVERGFEAVSPYGYSGTAALAELPLSEWRRFRQEWRRQAPDFGVVAEFQRLSPFVPGGDLVAAADPAVAVRRHNEIVVVDSSDPAAYWSAVSKKVRNRVRRAERVGYRCVVTPMTEADVRNPSGFRSVYAASMERVVADSTFRFDENYYLALLRGLPGAVHLARVVDGTGELVAAGIFFVWGDTVHCHLGGARSTARVNGATVLRLHEQIRWAAEQGLRLVNLGGGRQPGDSLFAFKASFGGRRLPYSVASCELAGARS